MEVSCGENFYHVLKPPHSLYKSIVFGRVVFRASDDVLEGGFMLFCVGVCGFCFFECGAVVAVPAAFGGELEFFMEHLVVHDVIQ